MFSILFIKLPPRPERDGATYAGQPVMRSSASKPACLGNDDEGSD